MWQSMPPAVTTMPSQAMISVPGPMTMSTPGWVSGLPALRHAIADGFATPELHLFAIPTGHQGVVFFDLDDQLGGGQAQAVAHGGAEHVGVGAAGDAAHARGPCVRPRKPNTVRAPA